MNRGMLGESDLNASTTLDTVPLVNIITNQQFVDWNTLKNLLKLHIVHILDSHQQSITSNELPDLEVQKDHLLESIDEKTEIPFTIQRICELILYPNEHYKSIWKWIRGMEKVLLVTIPLTEELDGKSNAV
ncbi:hypothetical protein BC833DRAFT_580317 [Globomyces pollinis-pini]|nr:hypothetical protein BC833DRAFT_580317 [Globomyces pollinis-pini]